MVQTGRRADSAPEAEDEAATSEGDERECGRRSDQECESRPHEPSFLGREERLGAFSNMRPADLLPRSDAPHRSHTLDRFVEGARLRDPVSRTDHLV